MYLPPEIWGKIWRFHKRIILIQYPKLQLEKELRLPILELQIEKGDFYTGHWFYEFRKGQFLIWLKHVEDDDGGEAGLKWYQMFKRYTGQVNPHSAMFGSYYCRYIGDGYYEEIDDYEYFWC